jgi:hypothetical protein
MTSRGLKKQASKVKAGSKNLGLELMQIPALCMARGGGDDSSDLCSKGRVVISRPRPLRPGEATAGAPSRHETIN